MRQRCVSFDRGKQKDEMRNGNILVEKPEGKNHLEDLGRDGKTLEWILWKQFEKAWNRFMWLRIGTSGGLLRTR
jgi:hypothetical protein